MTINGIEFDIDFTDAEVIERYQEALEILNKEEKELKENKTEISPAEGIRQECKIVKDFLDYVLGEGSSKELFGEKNSLNKCLDIFEKLVSASQEQYKSYSDRLSKYSPDRVNR